MTMITKNVRLSSSDINKTIKSLKKLKETIKDVKKDIVKDVAEDGYNYLIEQYSNRFEDENNKDIHVKLQKTSNGYKIVAYGKDVVYEEFGTGDKGEKNPWIGEHKPSGIKPYNSGKYIREVTEKVQEKHPELESGKYWTYKPKGAEKPIYTQGMVAGMEMLHTREYLRKKIKETSKKKVDDVLSKV